MSSSTEDLEGRTEEAVDTNHLIVFVGEEEVHNQAVLDVHRVLASSPAVVPASLFSIDFNAD